MKKPLMLMIMDGFGFAPAEGNAIKAANTPNLDKLFSENPLTQIGASGMDVGLPDGQMGNSEVGHTNIGAGRVVYQELTRITKSIQDGDFFENPALLDAVNNALNNGKALHLIGLLSDGGVHSFGIKGTSAVHVNRVKALTKHFRSFGRLAQAWPARARTLNAGQKHLASWAGGLLSKAPGKRGIPTKRRH